MAVVLVGIGIVFVFGVLFLFLFLCVKFVLSTEKNFGNFGTKKWQVEEFWDFE